ncbi:MAG: membrane protein insertase YidC, partial [Ignavibacteria bacterium]|nr:membrane protein insertase YidC [Ignavibacteria bacterium]
NTYLVYLCPIEYDILKEYYSTLESMVDFGSFFGLKFLVRPIAEYLLLPLLKFLHSFISNYGLVIIVFSLIIKIALHPLTRQSMRSMKKMQLLQPKMTELKEKFKDNPQKMNQEVMKLYKTYGINPAGGCLPLLLQMPILIALYGLFRATIDLRHESFMLWITDLSTPDVIATLPFRLPLLGINQISGLALLLGITMFLQQKMSVTDPRQKAMIYIMPIMFTLLFAGFPSGLNLYYFMFNIFSIAQQWWMNKYGKQIELVPVKQSNKKGFMQRLLEQAEANAKERRKQMMKR